MLQQNCYTTTDQKLSSKGKGQCCNENNSDSDVSLKRKSQSIENNPAESKRIMEI